MKFTEGKYKIKVINPFQKQYSSLSSPKYCLSSKPELTNYIFESGYFSLDFQVSDRMEEKETSD